MPEMTAQEAIEWGKTLSFETVWAAIMKSEERFNKFAERVDRVTEKVDKVTERVDKVTEKFDKSQERFDKLAEKLDRVSDNVGGLNRSVGELIETLIAARLWDKFPEYNLCRAYQRIPLYDEKNDKKTDIDILLVDTSVCMAVEVKRELDRMDDVDTHIKRMALIRKYPPEQIGEKQLLAAMAGGVVDPDVKDYAHKNGFFVIELAGESVRLVPAPEGFEPTKW